MKKDTGDACLGARLGCTVEKTAGCLKYVAVVVGIPNIWNIGGDKGLRFFWSGGTVEGAGLGDPEYGSEYIEYSELEVKLLTEGVYDGDLSSGILDGNEECEKSELGDLLGTLVWSGIGVSDQLLDGSEDNKRQGP